MRRERLRQLGRVALRPGPVRPGVARRELAHVPLVGRVRVVQARDRTPAHRAGDGVTDGLAASGLHGCAKAFQVRRVERAVPGGAHHRGLSAAPAHPEHHQPVLAAGDHVGVVAHVAHRGLEIGHAPRRVPGVAVRVAVLAAQTGVHVDVSGLQIVGHLVVAVFGQRLLRGVTRRVDREHDRRGRRGEFTDRAGGVDLHGVRAVAVLGPGEELPRHEDAERLVVGGGRLGHVVLADLVVDVVRRVVAPGRRAEGERLRAGRRGTVRGRVLVVGARGQAQHADRGGRGRGLEECSPAQFHGDGLFLAIFVDAAMDRSPEFRNAVNTGVAVRGSSSVPFPAVPDIHRQQPLRLLLQ